MDNDAEKVKNTMLEIETLQKEYDIILQQYQEAMQTYINMLSEEDSENKCSKFKKTDKNVSQLCYDKIWHEQGCLTDTPQVNSSKTLDELVKQSYNVSISTNSNDITQCYGNNSNSYVDNLIKNGTFSEPVLTQNSFKYISSDSQVPNWNFNGAALMNRSRAWTYEIPYPNGSQAVSLQLTASISQNVNLKKNVKYSLKLFCSGRNCCNGVNPIKIELYDSNNTMVLNILNITPTLVWSEYTATFKSPDTKLYKLKFSGTTQSGDKSSGIQNIELTEEKLPIYPNILDYISIKGKTWWGTDGITGGSVETESECIALCEAEINCSGATFNPTKKLCWIRSGDSDITPGLMNHPTYGSDYALIKKLKYQMIILRSLNSNLIKLNEEIINKIKNIDPEIEYYENKKNDNSNYLRDYYNVLSRHKDEIMEQLDEYENIESQYDNSYIYVKQQHWTYNIYALLSLILIFITIKKIYEGENVISFFIMIGIIWAFYIFIVKFYKKK
jgi:hypothetical protein